MPRLPRIYLENCLYYITSRGNQGESIFKEEEDYKMYLELLKKYKEQYGFKMFSFCLMPNQLNLLIELKEGSSISAIMHSVNSNYTKYFNSRYNRQGHLFQERFKSVIVEKGSYALNVISNMHLQPVITGLVGNPSEYVYTSHSLYLYNKEPQETAQNIRKVLDLENETQEVLQAIAQYYPEKKDYADFISAVSRQESEELSKKLQRAGVFGSQDFIERVNSQLKTKPDKPEENKFPVIPAIAVSVVVLLAGIGLGVFYIQNKIVSNTEVKRPELTEKEKNEALLKDLNATEWTVELRVPAAIASLYPEIDKLTFLDGKISSRLFLSKGFSASNYTLVIQDNNRLVWETMQKSAAGESLFWRGEVEDGSMQGNFSLRQAGQEPQDVSFMSIGYRRKP